MSPIPVRRLIEKNIFPTRTGDGRRNRSKCLPQTLSRVENESPPVLALVLVYGNSRASSHQAGVATGTYQHSLHLPFSSLEKPFTQRDTDSQVNLLNSTILQCEDLFQCFRAWMLGDHLETSHPDAPMSQGDIPSQLNCDAMGDIEDHDVLNCGLLMSKTPAKSKAAELNLRLLKKLYKAYESNPEVNLQLLIPENLLRLTASENDGRFASTAFA
ncbi:Altered inheritance of mitochondria protein 24, mitochondrial [Fonsecaea monophora]|uniref:Altered inheritance of mitochondria protein 24, mitochondrial n=1 Tax=Fonsecaea monophora TaxID=254056 RepID=A0A177FMF7_9EURO|nr:Altered inheritance of mitochondria protein 24, mitochondrial [Fonsecaea monophora]OAG45503.1 Altered inheritance of mitochondria protein 24, mitochondrial [Fonsecaea monophora]